MALFLAASLAGALRACNASLSPLAPFETSEFRNFGLQFL
jgi:hypothetical protein